MDNNEILNEIHKGAKMGMESIGTITEKVEDLNLKNVLVVSPDMGAVDRARYHADMLKCDVGVFYKRRDLSKVVDGKNPIVEHNYVGTDVAERDIIVVDDMIASGGSMIEVAQELKQRGANKIYIASTFCMFTEGTEIFDKAHKENVFDKIYTTNLTYINKNIFIKPAAISP